MFIQRWYQGLTIWFLPKDGVFHPRKHWIRSVIPHSMGFAHCCTHHFQDDLGQMIVSYSRENYHIMCMVIHYLPLQCLGETIGEHKSLPPIFASHVCSQLSWKVKSKKHCPFYFIGMGYHPQWYAIMPKKWSLVSLTENSRRHPVT